MIGDENKLTPGYMARHIPPRSGLGLPIAIIDVAQDFLLAHLADQGIFDVVTFKGGTALRKLYAGAQGRFSTDIDLAAVEAGVDRNALAAIVAAACDVKLGPFTCAPINERNRWQIGVSSRFGNPEIRIKLDVGPPAWISREYRSFITTPIHTRYGFALPALPTMCLEEVLAEKLARLARKATARDASDLIWVAQTSPYSQFSRARVRRLAMLKIWVDNNGLQPAWDKAIASVPFSAASLFAAGREWDDEDIGMLATPPPTLSALESGLKKHYSWLADITPEEERWASAEPRIRGEVLKAVRVLEGSTLSDAHIY